MKSTLSPKGGVSVILVACVLAAAKRPLASLTSKSEKALQKLRPGTWQYSMLRDNLKALHLTSALMYNKAGGSNFTRADLRAAFRAIATMMSKTGKTKAKFSPGTSQHTLQRNRFEALRLAKARIKAALDN